MEKLFWIAVAGAAGTLSRYGLGGLVYRFTGSDFPWGTVLVNVIGCFLFGLVWAVLDGRIQVSPEVRTIVCVGFLGAFTTFSTFVFETSALIGDSQWGYAMANILVQNGVGIAALLAGASLGRLA